jgi:hypothetical protein
MNRKLHSATVGSKPSYCLIDPNPYLIDIDGTHARRGNKKNRRYGIDSVAFCLVQVNMIH